MDDSFQLQYGLASSTQRYMAKWALSEVLGLMHRYLQVHMGMRVFVRLHIYRVMVDEAALTPDR